MVLITLCVAHGAQAQGVSIIPTVGFSKDMRSVTSNRWNAGLNFGAGIFFKRSDALSIGGRIAYHNWSADGAGWAKDEAENQGVSSYNLESSTGKQSVIEIVPSVQYALTRGESKVKVAAQVGVGMFLVHQGEVSISGTFSAPGSSGHGNFTYGKTSLTCMGVQVGLPVTISGVVQVMPLYSLYFSGDAYHHIALNVGVVLGK